MDDISIKRIQLLHPAVRESAMRVLIAADAALTGRAALRISQGLRSWDEQAALYNQGRTTPGAIVTNAKPGSSWHNFGLAFDIVLIIDGKTASWDTLADFDGDKQADWMEVVKIAKAEGWAWGGDFKSFKDMPHFEKPLGMTLAQARGKYEAKNFVEIPHYISL